MNIANPLILTSFGIINMATLFGLNPKDFSPRRRFLLISYFLSVIGINLFLAVYIGQPLYGKMYIFVTQIPVYLGFLLFMRYDPVKLLFVLLTAITFSSLPVQAINTMRVFGHENPSVLLAAELLTAVFTVLLIYFVLRRDFQYILENCESRRFWLFCAIPVLYYLYAFAMTKYNFQPAVVTSGYWVRQIPSVIVFLSYILLIRVFRYTRETEQLQTEKEMAHLQSEAAKLKLLELNLAEEQTRQYRHDMRHHFALLHSLAEEGKLEEITAYLKASQEDIETFTPSRYCKNSTANMLFSYYQARAEHLCIALKIDAVIPKALPLSDTELCSLLSNILENAITAAASPVSGGREIFFKASIRQNKLLISSENPFAGTLQMRDGMPHSMRKDHGYGTKSIAAIAEAHGGNTYFTAENGIFTVKLVIPLE